MKLKQAVKEAELIVFDLDGSIVNSLDVFLNGFQHTLLKYEKKCSIDEIKKNMAPCSLLQIKKNLKPRGFEVISKLMKGEPSKIRKRAYIHFQKHVLSLTNEIDAFSDARQMVKQLSKKKKLALLTNSNKKYTEKILSRLKMRNFFKKLVYGDSGFENKASGLKYLMRAFHAHPKKVLYVGDAASDVKAAKKAGCISLAVVRWFPASQLREERPDFIVKSLKEMA